MKYGEFQLRQRYSEERIASEVERLAGEITEAYAGKEIYLLVVLKGAGIFAADLVRRIRLPLVIDYVQLSSYLGMESSGKIALVREPEISVSERHVLVVEDIVDTGLTLTFLIEQLRCKGAASIKVCTLLDKQAGRRIDIAADFVGIHCDGGFLVGYGLDMSEHLRELASIYEVTQNSPCGGVNDTPV